MGGDPGGGPSAYPALGREAHDTAHPAHPGVPCLPCHAARSNELGGSDQGGADLGMGRGPSQGAGRHEGAP